MYRKFNNNHGRDRNFSYSRGGSFRGRKTIKSFNPTDLISKIVSGEKDTFQEKNEVEEPVVSHSFGNRRCLPRFRYSQCQPCY